VLLVATCSRVVASTHSVKGNAHSPSGCGGDGRHRVPITGRGALPLDAQVHMINAAAGHPVVGTCALAANISAGWSHRF
jgi:hypothetical protein